MATCQTCRGSRVERTLATPDCPVELVGGPESRTVLVAGFVEVPCSRCGGTGIESCCDGEDRWQQDLRDDIGPRSQAS